MPDFGTDISFYPDMDPNLSLISGARVIAEATYRRLNTPRGTYDWDPQYGFDVGLLLNESLDGSSLPVWQREITDEVEKDERVYSAAVTITTDGGSGYRIAVALKTSEGPFVLVLGVAQVGVEILSAPQS